MIKDIERMADPLDDPCGRIVQIVFKRRDSAIAQGTDPLISRVRRRPEQADFQHNPTHAPRYASPMPLIAALARYAENHCF